MFRKLMDWQKKPVTLEDKLNSASALQGYALDVFRTAKAELEQAVTEFDAVRDEAKAEADRHLALAGTASVSREEARVQAIRLTELFG